MLSSGCQLAVYLSEEHAGNTHLKYLSRIASSIVQSAREAAGVSNEL